MWSNNFTAKAPWVTAAPSSEGGGQQRGFGNLFARGARALGCASVLHPVRAFLRPTINHNLQLTQRQLNAVQPSTFVFACVAA
jgi:hypothetical protein